MNTYSIIICITYFYCLSIRFPRDCRKTIAKVAAKDSKSRTTTRNREAGVDENRRITRSMMKAMLKK